MTQEISFRASFKHAMRDKEKLSIFPSEELLCVPEHLRYALVFSIKADLRTLGVRVDAEFVREVLADNQWMFTGSNGKFGKHFRSSFKRANINLADETVQRAGRIFRQYIPVLKKTYHMELSDRIDWEDGDFGDRDSCFWGGSIKARMMIEENGGGAVKIYKSDTYCYTLGSSRCLVLPWSRYIILFNAYGTPIEVFSKLLGQHFDCRSMPVRVESIGEHGEMLYFNGDAELLYRQDRDPDISYVEFDISCPSDGEFNEWREDRGY